jgi:RNA-binding protein
MGDPTTFPALSGKQKSHLRALAHTLEPVVQIGRQGLTEAVLREIDGALSAHELIKVKIPKEPATPPEALEGAIEAQLGARSVQRIGHLLLLYRPRTKNPRIVLPAPSSKGR